MSDKSPVERISEAVNESKDGELDGCVLIGHLTVCEWVGPDGNRWLSKLSGNGSGDKLPSWQERSYGFEVANYWWDATDEDD